MSFIFEFFWQIIFEWLIGAPGAFILWIFKRFEGSFSKTLTENINKSAAIGFCFWVILFAIISTIAKSVN